MYIAESEPQCKLLACVIQVWQCRFTSCNKYTTLGCGGRGVGEGAALMGRKAVPAGVVGTGRELGVNGNCLLSVQFCCEPKTALKNKAYL